MEYVDNPESADTLYSFNSKGEYSFISTYGAHGETSHGTYTMTDGQLIIHDTDRNKINRFRYEWLAEEERLHFTGREMLKTTRSVKLDRSLESVYDPMIEQIPGDESRPVIYFADPETIEWDVERERVFRAIRSVRKNLRRLFWGLEKSQAKEDEEANKLVNFNLERSLDKVHMLVVDHKPAIDRWIVYHHYGTGMIMTLFGASNTRHYIRYGSYPIRPKCFASTMSESYLLCCQSPDNVPTENLSSQSGETDLYEEDVEPVELENVPWELQTFHPLTCDIQKIKVSRDVAIVCRSLHIEVSMEDLAHLVEVNLRENLKEDSDQMIIKDTVKERIVFQSGRWFHILDKTTGSVQVVDRFSQPPGWAP